MKLRTKLLAGLAALMVTGAATSQLIYGNTFPFWNVAGPLDVSGATTLRGASTLSGATTAISSAATTLSGTATTISSPTTTISSAATNLTGTLTTVTNLTTSGATILKGTATNDSAAAGNVGELLTTTVAAGSAIAGAATTVSKNIATLSLTAGDWDVSATCDYVWTAVTATVMSCGYGTTTDVLLTQAGGGGVGTDPVTIRQATFGTTLSGTQTLDAPVTRVSFGSTTNLFLVANMTYTAGTFTQYGTIRARRVR